MALHVYFDCLNLVMTADFYEGLKQLSQFNRVLSSSMAPECLDQYMTEANFFALDVYIPYHSDLSP